MSEKEAATVRSRLPMSSLLKHLIAGASSMMADFSTNSHYAQPNRNGQADMNAEVADFCRHPYPNPLTRDRLRLVLFSERGTRLVYDSATVISLEDGVVSSSHRSGCGEFQFLPHREDVPAIARMVFGTLNTGHNRCGSLKIHPLEESNSILLTGIFSVAKVLQSAASNSASHERFSRWVTTPSSIGSSSPGSNNGHNAEEDVHCCYQSTVRSLDALKRISCDTSVHQHRRSHTALSCDRPMQGMGDGYCSLHLDEASLGIYCRRGSARTMAPAASPGRVVRQRRRQLSLVGLDGGGMRRDASSHSMASTSTQEGVTTYAAAIIFPNNERSFVFHHILQVERDLHLMLAELRTALSLRVSPAGGGIFRPIYSAWKKFADSVSLLHDCPRLARPAWLSLNHEPSAVREQTANEFCTALAHAIEVLNTKESRFFLSTLLSTVLGTHLAWVSSVAPPEESDNQYPAQALGGEGTINYRCLPVHNIHLAQLVDLYGGAGKKTRVVIAGHENKIIVELLLVLSYFVRCSSLRHPSPLYDIPTSAGDGISDGGDIGNAQPTSPSTFDFTEASTCYIPRESETLGFKASPSFALSAQPAHSRGEIEEPTRNDGKRTKIEDFSTTLLTGLCDRFSPHFILSGINTGCKPTSVESLTKSVSEDLAAGEDEFAGSDKSSSTSVEEWRAAYRNAVIVGDVSTLTVRVVSSATGHVENTEIVAPAEAVASMLEDFVELHRHGCVPIILLSFLEDRLRAMFEKSRTLVQLVSAAPDSTRERAVPPCGTPCTAASDSSAPHSFDSVYSFSPPLPTLHQPPPQVDAIVSVEHAASVLGCENSDLRLLLNIASTYFPSVLSTMV